jgi:hypothetical protein
MAEKCEHKSKKTLEKKKLMKKNYHVPTPQPSQQLPLRYFMNARTVEKSGPKPKKKRNLTKTSFECLEILDNKKCDV